MYQAIVTGRYAGTVLATLGPTDTRDEAARLARAWLAVYSDAGSPGAPGAGGVGSIIIERVEEGEEERD